MRKINIYVSPLYIISAFFIIYLGGLNIFCCYFVALALHEYSHIFVSKSLGYEFSSLTFLPYGAKLERRRNNISKASYEIIIALSGPLFNITMVVIIIALWWLKPTLYFYTYDFMEANMFIGLFNLLPLFPLDGGQAFLLFFKSYKNKKIAYKIMQILGVLSGIIFLIFFIFSSLSKINFSLFFMSIFLFVTGITPYNIDYQKNVNNLNKSSFNYMEHKEYYVNYSTSFLKLIKLLNANFYTTFVFVDNNFKVLKKLKEDDILNNINNGKYYL